MIVYTKNSIQDRSLWPKLPRTIDNYPAPPCGIDGDIRALTLWIAGIAPIETSDIRTTTREVDRMLDHNAGAAYDDARWVALDGISHVGKTYTITPVMLRTNDRLLAEDRPEPKHRVDARHIPVIYIGDQGASSKTLLESIAESAGIFTATSEKEVDLLRRLRIDLPLVGCRLIVVDEAHMLRRVGASRDLTDRLRIMLSLPVSFVFTGAGLRESALYRRTDVLRVPHNEQSARGPRKTQRGDLLEQPEEAAMQMRNRMKAIHLTPLAWEVHRERDVWLNRMNQVIKQLERIDGFDSSALYTREFASKLHEYAGGRTGTSFSLLKDTCEAAVRNHRSPTLDDLDAEYRMGTIPEAVL